ncbi:clathrin heavy chain 2 [Artibeus jamaicensis]|uniref:clathrin heavy chain 2 n=1 Tax=Artibeus jamaicensis TaxID=9417 RepID=UPI00235B2554|nr:clathrin heavy chain 2 [Artibeus jamaicensis]
MPGEMGSSRTPLLSNSDNIALAQRLEKHQLIQFRRIAVYLYKGKNQWTRALLKTASSGMPCSTLRSSGMASQRRGGCRGKWECFAASLFIHLPGPASPNVMLELAWRPSLVDLAMPCFTRVMREYLSKILMGMNETQPVEQSQQLAWTTGPAAGPAPAGFPCGGQTLCLCPASCVLLLQHVTSPQWQHSLCRVINLSEEHRGPG